MLSHKHTDHCLHFAHTHTHTNTHTHTHTIGGEHKLEYENAFCSSNRTHSIAREHWKTHSKPLVASEIAKAPALTLLRPLLFVPAPAILLPCETVHLFYSPCASFHAHTHKHTRLEFVCVSCIQTQNHQASHANTLTHAHVYVCRKSISF